MLFKQAHLRGIREGTVSLVFRRWKKPAVRKGSLIKTAIGLVAIKDIIPIHEDAVTKGDAAKAGFKNLDDLLKSMPAEASGQVYKIKVAYHSEDPRIALRKQTSLTDTELTLLTQKIERLDVYSKEGPWTREVLIAIQQNPMLRAVDLARMLGKEKDWLKINIRKLKNLGLTISHETGYEISPLGKVVLKKR